MLGIANNFIFLHKFDIRRSLTIASIVLLSTDVSETGLSFPASLRVPFLKMGHTLATFQSTGSLPVSPIQEGPARITDLHPMLDTLRPFFRLSRTYKFTLSKKLQKTRLDHRQLTDRPTFYTLHGLR